MAPPSLPRIWSRRRSRGSKWNTLARLPDVGPRRLLGHTPRPGMAILPPTLVSHRQCHIAATHHVGRPGAPMPAAAGCARVVATSAREREELGVRIPEPVVGKSRAPVESAVDD